MVFSRAEDNDVILEGDLVVVYEGYNAMKQAYVKPGVGQTGPQLPPT